MCPTCGCSRVFKLEHEIVIHSDALAATNRQWVGERDVLMLNLLGAPGAGKTSLLEAALVRLGGVDLSVIEGDQATSRDAERIRRTGCKVLQINTGIGCNVDAAAVATALGALQPERGGVVFVENVGNLVCPALFDLGERSKIVVMSVTEGEDKPLKYPLAFCTAELCVLTKVDLLPYLDFDFGAWRANVRRINPDVEILIASTRQREGALPFCEWIRSRTGASRASSEFDGLAAPDSRFPLVEPRLGGGRA